ncbi:hypothetical protein QBZ16_003636 [Prototheca wickerhamii]|uniref:Ku domain-containing protein n=1 Tax=Prototheca wickerhamii TaxID=3111 RepID=A0AAD9MNH5_PROWI|nr:hypothetical protein QBZ16_003636 [Prototheca wickerhamii]
MRDTLQAACDGLAIFIQSRMLTKAGSQVAVLMCGTATTDNDLHDETAASGDEQQYRYITVKHPFEHPSMDMLRSVANAASEAVPGPPGSSDVIDALAVALDALYKLIATNEALMNLRVSKRIVLVSNFADKVKADPDDAFKDTLVRKMLERAVVLDVVAAPLNRDRVGVSPASAYLVDALPQLRYILDRVPHRFHPAADAAELTGSFRSHDVSPTSVYSGTFSIGTECSINVVAPGATHELTLAREYRVADDQGDGEAVPEEERIKVYRYGKQLVPVSAEEEAYLSYAVARSIKLLGFVDADSIPRHHYMKDCWVMVPDKDDPSAHAALGALARAAARRGQVAIVRFVPTNRGAINVCVARPVDAAGGAGIHGAGAPPPHFVLNALPFAEDVRDFRFPSFAGEGADERAAETALEAARGLVEALQLRPASLGGGVKSDAEGASEAASAYADPCERLTPERTANPTLHAFLRMVADAALERRPPRKPGQDILFGALKAQGAPGGETAVVRDASAALRAAVPALGRPQSGEGKSALQRLPEDLHQRLADGFDAAQALQDASTQLLELVRDGEQKWNDADVQQVCGGQSF